MLPRIIGGSMKPKSAEALRQVPINAYLPVRDAIAFLASASAIGGNGGLNSTGYQFGPLPGG